MEFHLQLPELWQETQREKGMYSPDWVMGAGKDRSCISPASPRREAINELSVSVETKTEGPAGSTLEGITME